VVHGARSEAEPSFALCLGAAPSQELRDSLLMCRELSYAFCINSTLVGSMLRVDSKTAQHFTAALAEPTVHAVEQLAWLVDSSLVMLYDAFSARSNARPECAYEWHAWLCSRVFRRAHAADPNAQALPVNVCPAVCERTERACDSAMQCAETSAAPNKACTDYYNDSAVCGVASAAHYRRPGAPTSSRKQHAGGNASRHHKHGSGWEWYNGAAASQPKTRAAYFISALLIALLALNIS
jgi:hypothetical protein